MKVLRAILLGVLSGLVVIAATEWVSGKIFPAPSGLDLSDPEVLKTLIENAPMGALMMVLAGWYLGSVAGGAVTQKLLKHPTLLYSVITGAILNVSGIVNMLMIPHPAWFWGAANCLFIPGAFTGYYLANKFSGD